MTGCDILDGMLAVVGFLLVAWIVIAILGLLLEGLFWLFVVGVVLFLATAAWGWLKRSTT